MSLPAHPASRWLTKLFVFGWLASLAAGIALPVAAAGQYNGPPTTADRSNVSALTNDQSALFPNTPDTVLAPGDQITIRLFAETDYNISTRLGVDGSVLLPLIGIVNLRGLTISSAEQLIADRLETAGMYKSPQVILQITEGPSSVITVAGEMHTVIPVVGSRSLYAVLASGGGLPASASRTVTVFRAGQSQPVTVDIGNDPLHSSAGNIPIFPGDTVVVSRIGVIYVTGEFRNPGVVNMTNYGPLTLTQVSAMVGCPTYNAKYGELHIIRTVGDHRTVVTLNIKNVLYGKAPDPIMQPNDIVFLTPSSIKTSLSNGTLGSVLGLVSVGVAAIVSLR